MLSIQVTEVKSALDQVSDLVTQALGADKVDVFLYTPSIETLVAVGASDTAMARLERGIGMDRLPLANGGRSGRGEHKFRLVRLCVFQTGRTQGSPLHSFVTENDHTLNFAPS